MPLVDVVLERVAGVGLVGHAPVEQEDVEPLLEQERDGAVAGVEVEHVAAADEAVDDHHRRLDLDVVVAVAEEVGLVPAPDRRPWASAPSFGRLVPAAYLQAVAAALGGALDVALDAVEQVGGGERRAHGRRSSSSRTSRCSEATCSDRRRTSVAVGRLTMCSTPPGAPLDLLLRAPREPHVERDEVAEDVAVRARLDRPRGALLDGVERLSPEGLVGHEGSATHFGAA